MTLNVYRLSLILNNKCNLKCSYCFQHDKHRHDVELSLENIVLVCKFIKLYGNIKNNKIELTLIGGEPSLYTKWDELFTVLKNELVDDGIEFSIIRLFTNGVAINHNMINCVSRLKQFSEYTHVYITKSLNAIPDRTLININDIIDENTKIFEKTLTVFHQYVFTKDHVSEFSRILSNAYIDKNMRLDLCYPCKNDLNQDDFKIMCDLFIDFIQTHDSIDYDFIERVGMFIPSNSSSYHRNRDVMCDPIKGELSISPKGFIIPCVKCLDIEQNFEKYNISNVYSDRGILNDSDIQKWISYYDVSEYGYKCNECILKHYCNPCRLLLDIIDTESQNITNAKSKCDREFQFAKIKYDTFVKYIKNGGKNVWLAK